MKFAGPAARTGGHRSFGRAPLRVHEPTDLAAPGLPPELAFLAAEGFSPERLINAMGAASRAPSGRQAPERRPDQRGRLLSRFGAPSRLPILQWRAAAGRRLRCDERTEVRRRAARIARRGPARGHRAKGAIRAPAHRGGSIQPVSLRVVRPDLAPAFRRPRARAPRRGAARLRPRPPAGEPRRPAWNDPRCSSPSWARLRPWPRRSAWRASAPWRPSHPRRFGSLFPP